MSSLVTDLSSLAAFKRTHRPTYKCGWRERSAGAGGKAALWPEPFCALVRTFNPYQKRTMPTPKKNDTFFAEDSLSLEALVFPSRTVTNPPHAQLAFNETL